MPVRRSTELDVERSSNQVRATLIGNAPPTYLNANSQRFNSRPILSHCTGLNQFRPISHQRKSVSQAKGVLTCTKGLRENAGFGMVHGRFS